MNDIQSIIKGDDTFFNGVDLLGAINLTTDLDLTGWKASFIYQSVILDFEDISNKTIQPRFTAKQTSAFLLGEYFATLILFDAEGFRQTQFTDLSYKIIVKASKEGINPPEAAPPINFDITNLVNYSAMQNKPQINGVELDGNVSISDLGLQPKGDYPTRLEVSQIIASLPKFKIVVGARPLAGEDMTIYLEPKEGTQGDIYNEFLWVNDSYELLGTTAVDLTDYLTANKLGIAKISQPITEAEYEALTPDENTLYLIKED